MDDEQRRAYNREQKARKRHPTARTDADTNADTQPVDNADNADRIADRFADIADRFADKLAVILSDFAENLPGPAVGSRLPAPTTAAVVPVRADKKRGHADTRTNADNGTRTQPTDPRRDDDVIAHCSLCDNNGFVAIDDGTGAPVVRLCDHIRRLDPRNDLV